MNSTATKTRFMAKIKKTESGCWIWTGAKDRKGYGKFSVGGSRNKDGSRRNSMVSAHRIAYEMFIGLIPGGHGYHGTCVLHKCDTPECVNPEHLFPGSNADNVHDMDAKGRRINLQSKGADHGNAILNEDYALEIYRMCLDRIAPQHMIAKQFGVSTSTVNHINKGRLWNHITRAFA
jgi:HNH endonuclease